MIVKKHVWRSIRSCSCGILISNKINFRGMGWQKNYEPIIEPIESEITEQDLIELSRSVFCRKRN